MVAGAKRRVGLEPSDGQATRRRAERGDARRALGSLVLAWGLLSCTGGDEGGTTGTETGSASDGAATTEPPTSEGSIDTGTCMPGAHGCACDPAGACDDDLVCREGTCETFAPTCGDGLVDGDEQCDLGEALDDEGECKTDCTLAYCGDGLVGPGEACDDGNLVEHDQCTSACQPPACGDGALHDGEECDDGNLDGTDECTPECTLARCGDGYAWRGHEECDDGNDLDTDACTPACQFPECGDGAVNGDEPCDDGNAVTTDACIDCTPATCGDGHRWAGQELCDGTALGGATCMTVGGGFSGGTLACTAMCTYNTMGCTSA